jgi:hypothetical protein
MRSRGWLLLLLGSPLQLGQNLRAQSTSFEIGVQAPMFSIDGMARAAQLDPYQGACVFVSNALLGSLGDADILMLRVNGAGAIVQDLVIGDASGQGYHDVAKETVQADKHYYVTGYTRAIDTSTAHTFTSFLIKVDTALNFIWQKNYILPGQEMYAEAMTTAGPAHLLVAGKIYDGSDFHSFVMRTDTTGAVEWIKKLDMPLGENIECIRRLPSGEILISGSMIFGFELVLPFASKLSATGDPIWSRYYNYPPGFIERSSFQFIHFTSVDHIALVGYTDRFSFGGTDCYMVDIDTSGAVNWARTYGGPQFDEPRMIHFDASSEELVLAGSSGSFASNGAPFPMAMRLATDGSHLGTALYGDTGIYQPGRFFHGSRVGTGQRLLMGSRDYPVDDLYLVGTGNDLSNGCAYHPVVPSIAPQSSGSAAFAVAVSVLEPVVTDSALTTYHFEQATVLCDLATTMEEPNTPAAGLALTPSVGDGAFRMDGALQGGELEIRLFDPEGRWVWGTSLLRASEVRLPSTLSSGLYTLEVIDGSGTRAWARYQLVR